MSNTTIKLSVDLNRIQQICDFLRGCGDEDIEFDIADELMDLVQDILIAEIILNPNL